MPQEPACQRFAWTMFTGLSEAFNSLLFYGALSLAAHFRIRFTASSLMYESRQSPKGTLEVPTDGSCLAGLLSDVVSVTGKSK
jgi:hypothetical protein